MVVLNAGLASLFELSDSITWRGHDYDQKADISNNRASDLINIKEAQHFRVRISQNLRDERMDVIFGSCLCGDVKFKCENNFSQFHLCHCTQCQKATGSAHVSNLFTQPDNIEWVSGEDCVNRYDVPGRAITSAFCAGCGSPAPYLSSSGAALVVPAGSLDSTPTISPQDNIFWSERAPWYEAGIKSKKFDGFPT